MISICYLIHTNYALYKGNTSSLRLDYIIILITVEPCVKSGLLTLLDRLRPFILDSLQTALSQNDELNLLEPNICVNRGV